MLFSSLLLVAAGLAQVAAKKTAANKTLAINDAADFCLLVPAKKAKTAVALVEPDAIPACTGTNPTAQPNAAVLSPKFITSANYLETADYKQITGCLNPAGYGLDPNDQGGQFDPVSTPGSTCAGFGTFVQLIEPASGRYCLRCCVSSNHHNGSYCNTGRSQYGCYGIIDNGDFTLPNGETCPTYGNDTSVITGPNSTSTATAPGAVTTAPVSNTGSSGMTVPKVKGHKSGSNGGVAVRPPRTKKHGHKHKKHSHKKHAKHAKHKKHAKHHAQRPVPMSRRDLAMMEDDEYVDF